MRNEEGQGTVGGIETTTRKFSCRASSGAGANPRAARRNQIAYRVLRESLLVCKRVRAFAGLRLERGGLFYVFVDILECNNTPV
jgi:hypothetical protein